MNIQEIYEDIHKQNSEIEIKQNEPMNKHTSFKVGGNADIFIRIKTIDELKYIVKYSNEKDIPLTILGNGSNVLVKDNGIRGITITLEFNRISIKEAAEIDVEAGVKLGMLAVILQKKRNCRF